MARRWAGLRLAKRPANRCLLSSTAAHCSILRAERHYQGDRRVVLSKGMGLQERSG